MQKRNVITKKLLYFYENHRPCYYAYAYKRSNKVHPTLPYNKDDRLDYAVDSDDEWEEEVMLY